MPYKYTWLQEYRLKSVWRFSLNYKEVTCKLPAISLRGTAISPGQTVTLCRMVAIRRSVQLQCDQKWSWVFKSLKFWASTSYNLLENVKTLKRATRLPLIRFHLLLLIQGGCNPICICVIVWFSIFKVRLVLDKFVQLTLSLDGGAGDEPSWCLVFWVGLQINYYSNLSIISSIHREIR